MRPITDVASAMGLDWKDLEPYGRDRAKVPLDVFPVSGRRGKLIVVTAITPTPAGEGKTTTSVGLVQGLARIGKKPVLTIRQPSLGPVFGKKGGGAGGGKSTVEPSIDINLHFNGDFHALESAHNFLAAMADNAAKNGSVPGFDASGITWRRVTDAEDRALRRVITGIGGPMEGPLRETGFDISAASEVMAILALALDYKDLRSRLSSIVVGWTSDRKPVTAGDIKAVGAMMALLKDALKPNLVQTAEGQPAIVHTGPFGNIAHGCSSIVADRLALACGDYVVTEAGFGADLGFEKFMDIKVRQGGAEPSAAVVVVTVRGMKWHGGVDFKELTTPDVDAVKRGTVNLAHAIRVVNHYGLPAVVAINRFPDDSPAEVAAVKDAARQAGSVAVESKGFAEGGAGMTDLATAVVEAASRPSKVKLLYPDDLPISKKVETLASELYYAASVDWGPMTRTTARRYQDQGWNFPICMAKTHLSISADAKLRGVPKGHVLPIGELRVLAGARQIVTLVGNIMTLPGLPVEPNAWDIDLTEDGQVVGLLGA
ncbi:MAG: formate--tetrahydrofolate ligase [SAR202 cluster bacterium]|nr:formate--tetrahydrofolate ligase [SAR202 cluster bacterium]